MKYTTSLVPIPDLDFCDYTSPVSIADQFIIHTFMI